MRDLAPVAMIGTTPNLLVVTPSFPARSAHDLIRMAREKPGGITYATGGFGSSSHLAVALFGLLSGAKFNHVPYRGAGPALADVVAGHVDFTVATMPGAIQQVRSSGLRALGISSLTRSARAARRADHRRDRAAWLRLRRMVRRLRSRDNSARAGCAVGAIGANEFAAALAYGQASMSSVHACPEIVKVRLRPRPAVKAMRHPTGVEGECAAQGRRRRKYRQGEGRANHRPV
jgi:hypothetical protein